MSTQSLKRQQAEVFEELRPDPLSANKTPANDNGPMRFAQLARNLQSDGLDKLFGQFFGQSPSASSARSQVSILSEQASKLRGGSDQTYAAPLGTVTRAPLGPIEVSLPQSSSRTVERAGNAFLSLIRQAEGTSGPNGYNTSLAYGRFTGGEKNLTGMTLGQIDQLQTAMLAHPDNSYNSSALGAYQIVRTTLRELKAQNALPDSTLFSAELQDKLALQLANRRGASVSGLRSEWEGFRRVDAGTILSAYNSRGTDASSTRAYERATERGVAKGLTSALPSIDGGYAGYGSTGAIPIPTPRPSTGLFSQAGLSVLGAAGGIFAQGYESGNLFAGGLGGALSGFGAAESIATAFPSIAGISGPLGLIGGAAIGALGSPAGGKKITRKDHLERAGETST